MKALISISILCFSFSIHAKAQYFFGIGTKYSIGDPSAISGYSYNYDYSGAFDAISEEIETVKGGFAKAFYTELEFGKKYPSNIIWKGRYGRTLHANPVSTITKFNYYGQDYEDFKYTITSKLNMFSFLLGGEKEIGKDVALQLLVGPTFVKGTLNQLYEQTNSFDDDWHRREAFFKNKLNVGASLDVIYIQKIKNHFNYYVKVNYEALTFIPKTFKMTYYTIGGRDVFDNLEEYDKNVEFSNIARKKYTIDTVEEIKMGSTYNAESISMPISGIGFSLGLVYTI